MAIPAEGQALGEGARVEEDHHRHHALGREELGELEAVVGQAMDGEPARLRLLLEDEQQRLAPPVGPLHEQGHVELAEALAEPLLELLLANGQDPYPRIDTAGLGLGEEAHRLAGVVDDEVLEVLVVTHGPLT